MKKIFLSIIIIALLFSSCTTLSEVEVEDTQGVKRLIKIEMNEGNSISTLNFIYEGDFLKEIEMQGANASIKFKYDQEKIIERESPDDIYQYEYNGDKVLKETYFSDGELYGEDEYIYGLNNELQTVKNTSYVFLNGVKTPYIDYKDYEYDASNNSVKATNRDNNQDYITTIYDDRINPYTSVNYFSPLLWITGNAYNNNVLEMKQYYNGDLLRSDSYSYEFDNDGFITKETLTETYFNSNSTDTNTIISNYFYNK